MKIITFGYRKRPAPDADHVLDIRCIYNPHSHFKHMDGRDIKVQEFLFHDIMAELLPWMTEHKLTQDCTIAIGCGWGKHRSVATAEILARNMRLRGWHVEVQHLELPEDKQ